MKAYDDVDSEAYLSALKEATGREWIEVLPGEYYKLEEHGYTISLDERGMGCLYDREDGETTWGILGTIRLGSFEKAGTFVHYDSDEPQHFARAGRIMVERASDVVDAVEAFKAIDIYGNADR